MVVDTGRCLGAVHRARMAMAYGGSSHAHSALATAAARPRHKLKDTPVGLTESPDDHFYFSLIIMWCSVARPVTPTRRPRSWEGD